MLGLGSGAWKPLRFTDAAILTGSPIYRISQEGSPETIRRESGSDDPTSLTYMLDLSSALRTVEKFALLTLKGRKPYNRLRFPIAI